MSHHPHTPEEPVDITPTAEVSPIDGTPAAVAEPSEVTPDAPSPELVAIAESHVPALADMDGDEESAPEAAPAPDEGKPLQQVLRKNFVQEADYTSTGLAEIDGRKEWAAMPSRDQNTTADALSAADNNVKLEQDLRAGGYATVVGLGSYASPMDGGQQGTATREDADWRQVVPSAIGGLAGQTPKVKHRDTYTPEAARNLIRSSMKLGTIFRVPLWHSGFWITIKAPGEGEILELVRRILSEKVTVGRQTYGLMFSNVTAYTASHLTDFIVENLYESSLALPEAADIREHIKMPDLSLLIWGLACAIYPTGFQYRRACIVDPEKCRHIVEEKLNLSRLMWTDMPKLTERQISHMTMHQRGKMTVESLAIYQNDFLIGKNKLVKMNDELSFELTVPSLSNHIGAAHRWVGMIEDTYGRVLSYDEAARREFLTNQAKATMMREFAHCVAKIKVGDQEFDDLATIENALNDLTANDDLREQFIVEVQKFLDDALVSFIAIPTYSCPACGKHQRQADDGRPYPELIPLDVAQTFFSLAYQRTKNVQDRDLRASST